MQHPRGAGCPQVQGFHPAPGLAKPLCDVFDDEINRIVENVGSRAKAFKLMAMDNKLVRFYLPFVPDKPEEPVWSVIRKLTTRVGEELTSRLREIAKHNPLLEGIIDRVDFNATTHGVRDIEDDRLSPRDLAPDKGGGFHDDAHQPIIVLFCYGCVGSRDVGDLGLG